MRSLIVGHLRGLFPTPHTKILMETYSTDSTRALSSTGIIGWFLVTSATWKRQDRQEQRLQASNQAIFPGVLGFCSTGQQPRDPHQVSVDRNLPLYLLDTERDLTTIHSLSFPR